ncbi:MAG: hypothetical protein KDB86_11860 [Actinobacteria bacterium]|nr:hypothetical protein [Actinomycetota bacterium]MCB9389282.1 hypothetical protein [Acidimicrobiia bacterium]
MLATESVSSTAQRPESEAIVVVPIRSFASAKTRLSTIFDDVERRAIAEFLAWQVVTAAPTRSVVISGDDEVLKWAQALSAETLRDDSSLDRAATVGAEFAYRLGAARTIISHADLVGPVDFSPHVTVTDQTALTPCRHGTGSNVISFPSADIPRFAYGKDSARRHLDLWASQGRDTTIVSADGLAFDLDTDFDWFDLTPEQVERIVSGAGLDGSVETWREGFDRSHGLARRQTSANRRSQLEER